MPPQRQKERRSMNLSSEARRSCKFYTCIFLGFALLVLGALLPPMGVIHNSMLVAGGMILTIAAGCIGIDFAKILHEINRLKQFQAAKTAQESEKNTNP